MPKKAKRKAAAVAPAVSLAARSKAKRKMQKKNVVVKQDAVAVARPTLLRLGLERIDWGHRFLGSHGDEYEAASRQLNYLRERNRDDKLDAQAMYDAFAKLDCLVRQIPGDAFFPPVDHIQAQSTAAERACKSAKSTAGTQPQSRTGWPGSKLLAGGSYLMLLKRKLTSGQRRNEHSHF